MTIRTKLTISHIAVTLISFFVFGILMFGSLLYIRQTNRSCPDVRYIPIHDIISQENWLAIIAPYTEILNCMENASYPEDSLTQGLPLIPMVSAGLLTVLVITSVVAGIAGGMISRVLNRRIFAFKTAGDILAEGKWNQRIPLENNDELDQLATYINSLADRMVHYLRELRTLADRNALLAEEARSLARVEERSRLARELHDGVKQRLFGLSLTAGSIPPLLKHEPDVALERIHLMTQQVQTIQEEMDNIVMQLHPASLADRGLAIALRELVDNWTAETQVPVAIDIQAERELPIAVEQALYRVAQEALNNAARHGQPKQVFVALTYELSHVELKIVDNGCGFVPYAPKPVESAGIGIDSMRARIDEVNGQLSIESQPRKGTTVLAKVPVQLFSS